MGNIFEDGLDLLKETLRDETERPITYRVNATGNFFTIPATRGNISYGTIRKMGGIPMDVDYREYIVRVDVLPKGFLPEQRDVIIDADGRWEAFNSTSRDCWRYCDPDKQLIRIFVRRINNVDNT